jgi:hypothetical protein
MAAARTAALNRLRMTNRQVRKDQKKEKRAKARFLLLANA